MVSPRRFFAMAQRGDLPRSLATVHAETGVPVNAVLVTMVLSAVLAASGTFAELAALGVVARFLQYIPTCLAAIVLRRRGEAPEAGFRLPGGPLIPLVTVGLCVVLLANTAPDRIVAGGVALLVGVPLYGLSRLGRKAG